MAIFKSPVFKTLLPLFIVLVGLRLIFWLNTFPNPDEAYYWLWGQHPDFSYYDHPPFQAWSQGATTILLGQSFFTLRLSNLVSNLLLFYTYYRITHYLYGKDGINFFWLTIAFLLTSPLYFLFLALAWPDHWLITFSLMSAFQFIQFLDGYTRDGRGHSRQLYGAAIALGLALLCKYNAVFMGLGFLVTIIAHPQWRRLLRDRRFYGAIALVLVCLLPIVIWNMGNDWQSWRYYRDRSVDHTFHLKLGDTLTFIGVSILTVSPIYSWMMAKILWRFRRDRQHLSTYEQVTVWIFIASTLTLLIISVLSTALYYWNILAYLLLFPLLPSLLRDRRSPEVPEPSDLATGTRVLAGQFYGLLFALLLVVHYSVLPLSVFGSADGDPDSRLLFGWEQVAPIVKAQTQGLHQPFLVTTDYRTASALAFQLNEPTVLAISPRIDQFDFWFHAQQLQGRDAVILADRWHPLEPQLIAQFERISAPETVAVKRFGVWIKDYTIVRGYAFKANTQSH